MYAADKRFRTGRGTAWHCGPHRATLDLRLFWGQISYVCVFSDKTTPIQEGS